jgi:hypothetical protein
MGGNTISIRMIPGHPDTKEIPARNAAGSSSQSDDKYRRAVLTILPRTRTGTRWNRTGTAGRHLRRADRRPAMHASSTAITGATGGKNGGMPVISPDRSGTIHPTSDATVGLTKNGSAISGMYIGMNTCPRWSK